MFFEKKSFLVIFVVSSALFLSGLPRVQCVGSEDSPKLFSSGKLSDNTDEIQQLIRHR